MKRFLLICSLLFSTYSVAEQANATTVTKAKSIKEMTPKELFKLIEEDVDDLYILDIREYKTYILINKIYLLSSIDLPNPITSTSWYW